MSVPDDKSGDRICEWFTDDERLVYKRMLAVLFDINGFLMRLVLATRVIDDELMIIGKWARLYNGRFFKFSLFLEWQKKINTHSIIRKLIILEAHILINFILWVFVLYMYIFQHFFFFHSFDSLWIFFYRVRIHFGNFGPTNGIVIHKFSAFF